ncbi:MAG: glycosyltransferase family 39 protein [Ardenticatenaceae bacterium]|nr:glycosyltransferase family 39 protein [Ardenticatenaceae bacterium]
MQVNVKKHELLWLLVAFLLMGAALRWAQLHVLSGMLNTDEAANGLDALSLIQQPRLTPFFPSYTGRESGWHYWLVPFLLAFGTRALAIRLAATMIGLLTLPAVYLLGCELLPRRAAVWAAGALAVLYWHVHLSQIGFRAILMPLVGALALAWLLRAYRTNRSSAWWRAGLWLGLLAYTYFSARVWLAYAGLLLLVWGVREPEKRRGVLLAGGLTAVLALPLFLYTTFNPSTSLNRIGEVSVLSVTGILNNSLAWLGAWFGQGDQNVMLNLPGRPILDWFLGVPFAVGVLTLWQNTRAKWQVGWLIGLAGTAVVPSLLSDHAPHFLRAIGLVLPVALVAGAGLYALEQLAARAVGRAALALPLLLLLAAGLTTANDFGQRWRTHPDLPEQMELPLNEAAAWAAAETTAAVPLYVTHLTPNNPTLLFWAEALAPRPVAAFDPAECWVQTDTAALYLINPASQPPLAAYETVTIDEEYQLILAEPDGRIAPTSATFNDSIQLGLAAPLSAQIQPGETLHLTLNFHADQPTADPYSLFLHLYGDPSPYEGGPIWAQIDQPLCPSHPMTTWRPFETIRQTFSLTLPTDLPPGEYTLVTGLYQPASGQRLPLTGPAPNEWNHFELADLEVRQPSE